MPLAQPGDPNQDRQWGGEHGYGPDWRAIRASVIQRDGEACRLCGRTERLEVHPLVKHKGHMVHQPDQLITLCGTCHRKARNPHSEEARRLARRHCESGKPCAVKVACTV